MSNRVLPILRLAVMCERIEPDDQQRPFCFVPVHTIQFPPGVTKNYRPPTLHVYLQLQEALGAFNLAVVLRREKSDIDLWRSDPELIAFDGTTYQIIPFEQDAELLGLVIPEPGDYEFWVYTNHVNLHNPDRQPGWPFPPMKLKVLSADGTEGGVV